MTSLSRGGLMKGQHLAALIWPYLSRCEKWILTIHLISTMGPDKSLSLCILLFFLSHYACVFTGNITVKPVLTMKMSKKILNVGNKTPYRVYTGETLSFFYI